MSQSNVQLGHRLAEAASAINRVADELRGMDRRGSYVNPTAAAERALRNLPSSLDPDTRAIVEAIKELAHGLASLTRQVI